MNNVFLNGRYLSSENAFVPLEDRGMLFGDGVYEVVRVYRGTPFLLREHLIRLGKSAAHLQLEVPHSIAEMEQIVDILLRETGIQSGKLYFQLTRGVAPRSHEFPRNTRPTFFVLAKEQIFDHKPGETGVRTLIFPDDRWNQCHIKSINLLPNVLSKEKARRKGAYEALFFRREVGMTEGSSSNIFALIGGELVTTPEGFYILSGITRKQVLQLALARNIPTKERYLQKSELVQAEEVFLTSTVYEITPVVEIDGHVIGRGHPGPITRALQEGFLQLLP